MLFNFLLFPCCVSALWFKFNIQVLICHIELVFSYLLQVSVRTHQIQTGCHSGASLNFLYFRPPLPEMCNLLLNQYNSVFSTPCREKDSTNLEDFFNVEDSNVNDILSDIIINQSVICDTINEMSSSSASGPDGLPAILFKECRDELSIPLQILFAKSFSVNNIAQCLKSEAIVPVYKGGGASIPSNYTPISLTSIMMKILERVIRKKLLLS